jgi:hypothetical protein
MAVRLQRTAEVLRTHGASLGAGLVLLALVALAVHWIVGQQNAPPPRKVMQFTVVNVQPAQPPRPPPPPPPQVTPPKVVEPETTRVELKATDIPPPDASPPPEPAAGGRLALAAEGEGAGDAFNLAGNPGGRGLLSGGGLGDGTGEGFGQGGGAGGRYAWYFSKIAATLEGAFGRNKRLGGASLRVELRVFTDAAGVSHVELVRSTGNLELDQIIRSTQVRMAEPPPRDLPPAILRLTVRRPS